MSRPSLILCREARASEPCQAGSMSTPTPPETPRITVQANGPYLVLGGLPLRRKRAVVSEHADPVSKVTILPAGTYSAAPPSTLTG